MFTHHLRIENPQLPISLIFKAGRTKSWQKRADPREHPYGHPDDDPTVIEVESDGQKTTSSGYEVETWSRRNSQERFIRQTTPGWGLAESSQLVGAPNPIILDYQNPQFRTSTSIAPNSSTNADNEGNPDYPPYSEIQSLIVCLKSAGCSDILSHLAPRLTPSSVVTLLQNGMGLYEELCETLWPNPERRPQFIIGTTTHAAMPAIDKDKSKHGGIVEGGVIHITRPGQGEVKWGIVDDPRRQFDFEEWLWGQKVGNLPLLDPPTSPSLPLPIEPHPSLTPLRETLAALLSISQLGPSLLPRAHHSHEKLLKVALNSLINPLTAILGSGALTNGALLYSKWARSIIEQLSHETSNAITAHLIATSAPSSPEPEALRLFSAQTLQDRTMDLISHTRRNISSMAQDVSKGRPTEINYINGYIVDLGQKYYVPTPCHQMIMNMVEHTTYISGLGKDIHPSLRGKVQALKDRKEVLAILDDFPHKYSDRRMEFEESKVELEILRLRDAEEQRRAEWIDREYVTANSGEETRVEEEIMAEGYTPFQASPLLMDRDELLKMAAQGLSSPTRAQHRSDNPQEVIGEMAAPRTATRSSPSPESSTGSSSPPATPITPILSESAGRTADVSPSTRPTWSPHNLASSSGLGLSIDAMIASAPRQERTWEVPATPPTFRGPLPKKRTTAQKPPISLLTSLSTTLSAPTSAQPQTIPTGPSSPAGLPRPSAQNGLMSLMDSMISSAPRQERSWEIPVNPPLGTPRDMKKASISMRQGS